ncbi:MAG: VOC family protein [Planctomycetota bacterium]
MKEASVHGVGGVLSADIAVPNHPAELAFYSRVLTSGDTPLWREDLMNILGMPVIGLGERTAEYDSLPLQWMPHFQVADVAAAADHAVQMGGSVIMRSGEDHWAVLADPAGAHFGVIPVVASESTEAQGKKSGRIAWLSLNAKQVAPICDFYERVIGWTAMPLEHENNQERATGFEMRIDDRRSVAEISQQKPGQDAVPPVWLIHLPVDDLQESLQRVRDHGGQVVAESSDTGSVIVCDPIEVFFALCAEP